MAGLMEIRSRRFLLAGAAVGLFILAGWLFLRDSSPSVQVPRELARIDRLESSKDVAGLTRAARDADAQVAGRALGALARVGGKRERGAVEQGLADKRWEVRQAAAAALGTAGDREFVEPLNQALRQDPSPEVRAAAARTLGELSAWDGVGPLIDALDDPHPFVRTSAFASAKRILGLEFPYRPDDEPLKRQAAMNDVRRLLPIAKEAHAQYMERLEQREKKPQ